MVNSGIPDAGTLLETRDFSGSTHREKLISAGIDVRYLLDVEVIGHTAAHLRLERIIRKIHRRTRVVGAFPDGHRALLLVAARLRHIASTRWGKRRYLTTETLLNPIHQEAAA